MLSIPAFELIVTMRGQRFETGMMPAAVAVHGWRQCAAVVGRAAACEASTAAAAAAASIWITPLQMQKVFSGCVV